MAQKQQSDSQEPIQHPPHQGPGAPLAHSAYNIVASKHPNGKYIIVVEQVCQRLEPRIAELGAKISDKHSCTAKPNINREEIKAFKELRKDKFHIILTVDKEVAMVVLYKQDYIQKAENLLQKQEIDRTLPADPTKKQKNKLINLSDSIKVERGIENSTYKKMYPTGDGYPKFYGLPKTHNKDIPLYPIVSSSCTVTYRVAKELARILRHLIGKFFHHIRNTKDFVREV